MLHCHTINCVRLGLTGCHSQRLNSNKHARQKNRLSSSFNFTPINEGFASVHSDVAEHGDILDRVDALRAQGNTQYRSKKYKDSLLSYTTALELYPNTISIPPPLSLLTNRAAAYISLGQWEDATKDMRQALSYPCSDIEGNVKRLGRYLRCLLALGKVESDEATEAIKHAQNQLLLLEQGRNSDSTGKVHEEAQKALEALQQVRARLQTVTSFREAADWSAVRDQLEILFAMPEIQQISSKPAEWKMMQAEALAWLGKPAEAKILIRELLADSTAEANPAKLWFQGLLAYAQGDMPTAVEALDQLRLITDLHSQAS